MMPSKNEILHFIAYQEDVSLPHPDHVARIMFKDVESDHLWNCADWNLSSIHPSAIWAPWQDLWECVQLLLDQQTCNLHRLLTMSHNVSQYKAFWSAQAWSSWLDESIQKMYEIAVSLQDSLGHKWEGKFERILWGIMWPHQNRKSGTTNWVRFESEAQHIRLWSLKSQSPLDLKNNHFQNRLQPLTEGSSPYVKVTWTIVVYTLRTGRNLRGSHPIHSPKDHDWQETTWFMTWNILRTTWFSVVPHCSETFVLRFAQFAGLLRQIAAHHRPRIHLSGISR